MAKKPLDIEKMFEKGFDGFEPKPSKKFEKRMAAHLGFSAAFGLTFSTYFAKLGASLNTIAVKTAAVAKAAGIIKTIAVVSVATTTVSTGVFIFAEACETSTATPLETEAPTTEIVMRETHEILVPSNTKKINLIEITEPNRVLPQREKQKSQYIGFAENDYYVTPKKGTIHNNPKNTKLPNIQNSKNIKQLPELIDKAPVNNDLHTNQLVLLDPIFRYIETVNSQDSLPQKGLNNTKPINPVEKELKEKREIFRLNNYQLFGDAYFMPFMFNNTLSKSTLISDSIIDQNISEAPQLSYQFGLDFILQHKERPWFLNVGLNYQTMKEDVDYYFKVEHDGEIPSFWVYDSIYYYVINPPNLDTILNVDSAYTDNWIRKENYKSNVNSYQFLNIPIMLGYNFTIPKTKVRLQFSTGVSMALRMKSTGYLYNNYGEIINYNDVKMIPTVNWYYLASLGLSYQHEKTTMFLQPTIKYQLNREYIKDYPVEHKYFIYGVKLGVRFTLF